MTSKKRARLQLFDIIYLSNPDLRTLRNKQNYVYALSPLENFHQEPFSIVWFLFHPFTYLETMMTTASRAYIYALKAGFPKLPKSAKSFAKLLEEYFNFLPKKSNMATRFGKLLETLLPTRREKIGSSRLTLSFLMNKRQCDSSL
jgi:hypothetical protein